MRRPLFSLLRSFSRRLGGRGLSRLPFATTLYQFFYDRARPRGIVTAQAQGFRFLVNAADTALAPHLLTRGVYASDETALLPRLLAPGMTFVDVGASIGYFTAIASRAVGARGRVLAFEPDEENFSLLQQNIAQNGLSNATAVKKALADRSGTAQFFLNDKNLCSHTLVPRAGDRVVSVETETLDEYFRGAPADVIKLDVEGAEPRALSGMRETIIRSPRVALLTEFFPEALRRGGFDPKRYLDDLRRLGFTLYRVEGGAPEKLSDEDTTALAEGAGVRKLTYLLCLKGRGIDAS